MPAVMILHGETASMTSLLTTEKLFSHEAPNVVVIATSAASRPVAIRTRPIRG